MFEMIPFKRHMLNIGDDDFGQFFRDFFNTDFTQELSNIYGSFKVDLKETKDNYLVEADLPGMDKKAINIDYESNYLTVSVKRDDTIKDEKENYVRRERHYGEFIRSFYIDNVDEDKIDASFKDGVLKITLPKLTNGNDKKKKIDIH
ncbi:heat shock protein Hsp18 [Candidatus Clostridium stratigraminis]|uniref:Heat shock protein Hsp18 n=1 Tax=Candidatus Clostridium stratigraminis TaxID=3381661 RepID=A0ABW8T757_9CLOT